MERTLSIEQRLVPDLFYGVDVYPTLAMFAVDFGPDVVLTVPDPADAATDCATQHAEAVGPLADTALSGVQQDEGVVVAGEALKGLAVGVGALVELDPVSATSLLVGDGCDHAVGDGGGVACGALWVVDPLEEVSLEPAHESSHNAVLVGPGRLRVWAQRGGLGEEKVRLLLGVVVDALKRDDTKGFVKETRVLPTTRRV